MSSNNIIPCKHDSPKKRILVDYDGIEKTLDACESCIEIIKLSSICEIKEFLN